MRNVLYIRIKALDQSINCKDNKKTKVNLLTWDKTKLSLWTCGQLQHPIIWIYLHGRHTGVSRWSPARRSDATHSVDTPNTCLSVKCVHTNMNTVYGGARGGQKFISLSSLMENTPTELDGKTSSHLLKVKKETFCPAGDNFVSNQCKKHTHVHSV